MICDRMVELVLYDGGEGGTLGIEDDGAVILRAGSPATARRCTVDELVAGQLDLAVVRAFDLRVLVEALARLILRQRGEAVRAPTAADGGRPSVSHLYGFGRGVPKAVWLMGRNVWADAAGRRYQATFEDFLAAGFPADTATDLGLEVVQRVTAAVRQLAPLPCKCDTGVETPDQHGTLDEIVRRQHPFAPIDVSAVVGRCRVCGRGWTFEAAGDSHYSYSYEVHPFVS